MKPDLASVLNIKHSGLIMHLIKTLVPCMFIVYEKDTVDHRE